MFQAQDSAPAVLQARWVLRHEADGYFAEEFSSGSRFCIVQLIKYFLGLGETASVAG